MWKPLICKALPMSEEPRKSMSQEASREERLAAQLRENLRRRKAQARALADSEGTQPLPNPSLES